MSLAKYLLIVAKEDDPGLDIHDIAAFLRHLLERVDWANDLHFQTRTTIDTLDYSGHGLNQGSKVVIAAAGPRRRDLPLDIPGGLTAARRIPFAPRRPAGHPGGRRGRRIAPTPATSAAFCSARSSRRSGRLVPADRDRR